MVVPEKITMASGIIQDRKKKVCFYTGIMKVNVRSGIPSVPDKGNRFNLSLWTYLKSEPYIITTLWGFQRQEMRMVFSESFFQLDHSWIILSIAILKRALPTPIPPLQQHKTWALKQNTKQITSCFGFVHSFDFTFKTDRKINCSVVHYLFSFFFFLSHMQSKTIICRQALKRKKRWHFISALKF